jgi:hypothetical protein
MAGLLLIKEFMDWAKTEATEAHMFHSEVQYALNLEPANQSLCDRDRRAVSGRPRTGTVGTRPGDRRLPRTLRHPGRDREHQQRVETPDGSGPPPVPQRPAGVPRDLAESVRLEPAAGDGDGGHAPLGRGKARPDDPERHFEARRSVGKLEKSSQTAATGRLAGFTPGSAQQRPRTLSARRINNHFCRGRL